MNVVMENTVKEESARETAKISMAVSKKYTDSLVKKLQQTVCGEICGIEFTTFDYDRFYFLTGNRGICRNIIDKIKRNLLEDGWTGSSIAVVEMGHNLYIVDGQHRYVACKELGLPISYTMIHVEDLKDTPRKMNQVQHNWSTMEFILSQSAIGNKAFKNLLSLFEKYKSLPSGTVIAAVTNFYANSANGFSLRMIKEAKLTLDDEDMESIANKLDALVEIHNHFNECGISGKKDLFLNAILCAAAYGDGFTIQNFNQFFANANELKADRTSFENCMKSVISFFNSCSGRRIRYENVLLWYDKVAYETAKELDFRVRMTKRMSDALKKELDKKEKLRQKRVLKNKSLYV